MKVTYAELQRMMNTLNAMIQVKPGPIVRSNRQFRLAI